MEFNLLALLGISLAAMFFGYFFGLFEGRGQGYKKGRKEGLLENRANPSAEKPLPSGGATGAVGKAADQDSSLLRLSLDHNQQPQLDLDGGRVDTARLTPQQRKRLVDLMLVLRPWIDGSAAQAPAQVSRPVTTPPAAARGAAPSMMDRFRAASASDRPAQAAPLVTDARVPPAAAIGRASSVASAASAGTAGGTGSAAIPIDPQLSLVAQIDAVLQARLGGTALADLGVRLVEAPGGGVTVVVGNNRYASVGEVPDAEVQSAIRAAIAEWERKYTPA